MKKLVILSISLSITLCFGPLNAFAERGGGDTNTSSSGGGITRSTASVRATSQPNALPASRALSQPGAKINSASAHPK